MSFVEELLPLICNIVFGLDNGFVLGNVHHRLSQLDHRFPDQACLDLEEGGTHFFVVVVAPFQGKPCCSILSFG